MRQLRFYLFTFFIAIWLLILLAYVLLQTSFGVNYIAQQLTRHYPFTFEIGNIQHSLSRPYELTLFNLEVTDKNQPVMTIPKLVLGLNKNKFWQFNHLAYVNIKDAVINQELLKNESIIIDSLTFINTTINSNLENSQQKVTLQNITGQIQPFSTSNIDYQFDVTLHKLSYDKLTFSSMVMQGFKQNDILTMMNFGGNIDEGFFVSKFKILPDNSIDISELKLNQIHFQSLKNFTDFGEQFNQLPPFKLHYLSIFNTSIQLPSFLIENGNFEATNLMFSDKLQFVDSDIVFNADTIRIGDNTFSTPLIELNVNDGVVHIENAMVNWAKGIINANGIWKNNHLQLDQVLASSINYVIEDKIKDIDLPYFLKDVSINKLVLLPSLIIETDLEYPFALEQLEGSATNVVLVKDNKFGFYEGMLSMKAKKGSLLGVDFAYPDMTLTMQPDHKNHLKGGVLLDKGIVEIDAIVDEKVSHYSPLNIQAYNVDSSILTKWKLVDNPPPMRNFKAELVGAFFKYADKGRVFSEKVIFPIKETKALKNF